MRMSQITALTNQQVLQCPFNHVVKVKVKVKHSHYRPGQTQRVLRKLGLPDFMTTAQDGGKVVSLQHRQP